MSIFNGTCKIQDTKPVSSIQTDASADGGGGYYNGDYFYVNWNLDIPPLFNQHINVKEFSAIYLAMCRWGSHLCNKRVIIYSDNKSAVSWINKGTSRNSVIMYLTRLLFWICAINNISLKAVYLPGVCNRVADACSRLHESNKLSELYTLLPSLTCSDFTVYELSQHMSLRFIFRRWFNGGGTQVRGSPIQRQGVG